MQLVELRLLFKFNGNANVVVRVGRWLLGRTIFIFKFFRMTLTPPLDRDCDSV